MDHGGSESVEVRKLRIVAQGRVYRMSDEQVLATLRELWPGLSPNKGFAADDREMVKVLCKRLGIEVVWRRVKLGLEPLENALASMEIGRKKNRSPDGGKTSDFRQGDFGWG
jgi:hypothetical protein